MNAVFGGEGLSLATLANALRKAQGGDKPGPTGGLFSTNAGWLRTYVCGTGPTRGRSIGGRPMSCGCPEGLS